MRQIFVESLGEMSRRVLTQPGELAIQGITSKGVFLRHSCGEIVFLSREQFRGPYTLSLPVDVALPEPDCVPELVPGECIQLNAEYRLIFNRAQVYLPTDYSGPNPAAPRFEQIALIVELAQAEMPLAGLAGILADRPIGGDERWMKVWQAVLSGSPADWPAAFSPICGYGRGLTPSGDDFLLGMLLGVKRYGEVFGIPAEYRLVLDRVLQACSGRTTTISLNLLLAASLGMADERLISAFDGWVSSSLSAEQIHTILRTWGNSSGLDAFSGLAGVVYRATHP